jgi:hypothetical protein
MQKHDLIARDLSRAKMRMLFHTSVEISSEYKNAPLPGAKKNARSFPNGRFF